MTLQVLPLAITMLAGPQIMSAIIFVTTERVVKLSLAFLVGVSVAVVLGVLVASGVADLLGNSASLGDSSDSGSTGKIIQYALVALLVAAALKNYLGRETAEPPKWLGTLQAAEPRKALTTGFLLIMLMPSDVIVMLTVATNIEQHHGSYADALPFIAATILVAALPLLFYLLFRQRAERAMPKVRDWMNGNSWLVNIIVCGIFVVLILA